MSDEDLSGLPPAQPEESGDLADHEAAFGPNGTGELPDAHEPTPEADAKVDPVPDTAARDEQGRFQKTPRHRAKSQQASPEDVPRIRDLTAKLRAAEAERDALKNARGASSQPATPAPPPAPAIPRPESPVASGQTSSPQSTPPWTPPATRPEPSEDEIGDKYKTYAEFTKDQARWVWEQQRAAEKAQEAQEKQQQQHREWAAQYTSALADAKTRYPDYDTQVSQADALIQAQQITIPQVLMDAIVSSSRGPDVSYYLATHLDDYRELIRDAWAVNAPQSIAMVRRVLESKLPVASPQRLNGSDAAGSTGSAPRSPSIVPAPRPPNPVRTGPQKIGDDAPDDEGSLDAHESYFYKRGR